MTKFIEIKINEKPRVINVNNIVEIEPAGDRANILMAIGPNSRRYNVDHSYEEVIAWLRN